METIPFGRPILGEPEKAAVRAVLDGHTYVHGPKSKEFEESFARYVGGGHALSVASCTAGLHLAYFEKGVGVGDEVIVPAMTHTATAHAVELMGATPIFVDAEPTTGNIDISRIEEKITPRTKAISLVHFLGCPVDMDPILALARKYNLFVVEDAALAIGCRYKGVHAGLLGDVGCFSFYPVKHMTTAEGGMFLTKHAAVAERVKLQRAFGVDRIPSERPTAGTYDVKMLGFNYRMNEIEAAIGVEQIKRVPEFLRRRRENFETLERGLQGIDEIQVLKTGSKPNFESAHYCLSIILSDVIAGRREAIMAALKDRGIGTSIYYPSPVPYFTYYKTKYNFKGTEFPNAAKISFQSIALPVGPHLGVEQMMTITKELKDIIYKTRT